MHQFELKSLILRDILDTAIMHPVQTQDDITFVLKQAIAKNHSGGSDRLRYLIDIMAWLVSDNDVARALGQANNDFDASKYDIKSAFKQCANELWDAYYTIPDPTVKAICLDDEPPATHKMQMFYDADGVLQSRPSK